VLGYRGRWTCDGFLQFLSISAVAVSPLRLAHSSAVSPYYHHPRDDPERKRERSPTTPHRHIHTHNKHIDSHRIKEK
jgi:hypothetical protein